MKLFGINLKRKLSKVLLNLPAGQSTQMIVGATNETDAQVMYTAAYFYKKYQMKRVYYSGYIPAYDPRLPSIEPMCRYYERIDYIKPIVDAFLRIFY